MSDDIIDLIADDFTNEIVGNSSDYNGGRLTLRRSRDLAAQAIAALRERYAIVKLPLSEQIPDGDGYDGCAGVWTAQLGVTSYNVSIAAWSDDGTVTEECHQYAPQQARAYAAALLAAADLAEEGK